MQRNSIITLYYLISKIHLTILLYQFVLSLRKFIHQEKKLAIIKNSKEEKESINELRNRVSCIKITNILNQEMLEKVTQEFTSITEELWYKYSKYANITKHSKA